MLVTALYILRNKLVDQSQFEAPGLPHSLAYFCPTCGELWGRIAIITETDTPPYWSVESVACEQHLPKGAPEWSAIPGTLCTASDSRKKMLSLMWWGRALEHLPLKILKREFTLTLEYHARSLECQQ